MLSFKGISSYISTWVKGASGGFPREWGKFYVVYGLDDNTRLYKVTVHHFIHHSYELAWKYDQIYIHLHVAW